MIQESAVLRYTCTDGTAFDDKRAAEAYEAEYTAVLPIAARIPRTALSHGTYITHDREALRQIRRDLWPLVLKKVNAKTRYTKWLECNPDDVHPGSIVHRVLDDCGGPVSRVWSRLSCFDFETGREYDQPYFVTNPAQAKPFA